MKAYKGFDKNMKCRRSTRMILIPEQEYEALIHELRSLRFERALRNKEAEFRAQVDERANELRVMWLKLLCSLHSVNVCGDLLRKDRASDEA